LPRTPKRRHPNVSFFRDRHGKIRWRWRKAGFPTYYFQSPPDTPGFAAELKAAQAGERTQPGARRTIPRSVDDLCVRYYQSRNFSGGSEGDQRRRRSVIERFRAEFGRDLVENFRWDHIEAILQARSKIGVDENRRKIGGPSAARMLQKQLKRLFDYAVKLEWIDRNPVDQVEKASRKTKGFHSWTEAEITQYQKTHALGTMQRLAMELLLWTATRRSDGVRLGPSNVHGRHITFRPQKTQNKITIPLNPDLENAIAATKPAAKAGETFLRTAYGKPFSAAGFGNGFRDWCDQAGLPHCTAHGLRKAAARRLAEAGTSQQELKAVGGWKSDSQVAVYIAAADQKHSAEQAFQRLQAVNSS